ncbi:hypothetical protein BFP97_06430 [Roseivirga sp. 4D4]|uniref:hypothetical protein n=1 Tax=Roseivirga sp. 4D4 TaxID=1889784 RepID=UPI000853A9D3|nr:hypothetical protein [Roseivirga sp. 4D4]OEK01168.1 hypothetical protein BFP97_06430 [Roseivirga sp. 4D4]
MNQESLKAIQDTIAEWKSKRNLTYENKDVGARKSPITSGEYLLFFSNSVFFFCGNEKVTIREEMGVFQTMTLGNNSYSENSEADAHRLKEKLDNFDADFDEIVKRKLDECSESLGSTDPIFF